MNAKPWDPAGQARRALQGIAADPHYGAAALSQPAVMSNLLKDFLPDEPREASLLVAAAQADLAGALRGYVAQGLDAATAVNLTANSFVNNTSHTQEACAWVVGELALALGIDPAAAPQATAPPPQAAAPPGQPTLATAVNAAFNQATPPYPAASPGALLQTPWAAPATPTSPRGGGSAAAGIVGLLGALLVLIACFVPLSKVPGQPSFGVFFGHAGFAKSTDFWLAVQPILVLLMAVVAGIVLVARGAQPRARAVLGGVFLALGILTVSIYGFDGYGIFPGTPHQAGGILGILGGLAFVLGGIISLAGQARTQPPTGAAPTGS